MTSQTKLSGKKERNEIKQSKVKCLLCREMKNTFIVDYAYGYGPIRLCIKCAKEQLFNVDLSRARMCLFCSSYYIPKFKWQKSCPVCFIKSKKEKNDIKRS